MNYEQLALAGINVTELLGRIMNNEKLLKLLASRFLADPTCLQLKQAVEDRDWKTAEFACHSLKGICGNMALTQMFGMLQEQLRLFRSGEAEQAAGMTPAILAAYDQAVLHITLWLDQP